VKLKCESKTRSETCTALRHTNPQSLATLLVCVLLICAFSLACQLIAVSASAPQTENSQSLAGALVADSRVAIGSQFYTQADVYFHRGVPHSKAHAFDDDIFQRVRNAVTPQQPMHLSGASDITEIMPWLDLATRINPQNEESYLVAAFWLAGQAKRPDLALHVLNNAQCNISYSYTIQCEKGRILLHEGKHDLALQAFNAANAFWNVKADASNSDDLLDKGKFLLYRALLLEVAGKQQAAIEDLKALLSIPPDRPAMQIRLQQLSNGEPTQPSARDVLQTLLRKHAKPKCTRDHEGHTTRTGNVHDDENDSD